MPKHGINTKVHKGARKVETAPASPSRVRGRDWYWLLLFLVPPILFFPRLGDIYLWQDEAETAMIGRAIVAHGYPLAQVGSNTITDQPGQIDLNASGVWIWSPWLPGYLAALSFVLFGISTTAARLPFVLAGWASLFLQYAALRDITRNTRLSRYATSFLLASVPFILHVRQCRYYTLLVLFTIVQLWGYLRMVRRQSYGTALFLAGGIGLFYSWYPQLAVSLLVMTLHLFLFHRHDRVLRRFAIGCALIGVACLPFFLYSRGWSRDYLGSGHNYDDLWRFLAGLRAYLLLVHVYCWPGLVAVPLLWRRISGHDKAKRRSARNRVTFLALLWLITTSLPPGVWTFSLMGVALLALSAELILHLNRTSRRAPGAFDLRSEYAFLVLYLIGGCVVITGLAPFPFFRYFLGLLPLFTVLTALTVIGLAVKKDWVAWGLTTCLIACNLIQLSPFTAMMGLCEAAGVTSKSEYLNEFGYIPSNNDARLTLRLDRSYPRFESLPWEYLQEVTHDYVGPIEGVVSYLRAHARSNENIVTTYEQFSLMFYTSQKVYSSYAGNGIPEFPDWVLIHGSQPLYISSVLARALEDPSLYQKVPVPALEFSYENIPEPAWHRFTTPTNGTAVALYHRVQK